MPGIISSTSEVKTTTHDHGDSVCHVTMVRMVCNKGRHTVPLLHIRTQTAPLAYSRARRGDTTCRLGTILSYT